MNKKEISELRCRFSPDKNSIGHIYGCYVNTKRRSSLTWMNPLPPCRRRRQRSIWASSKKPSPAPRAKT